MSVSADKPPKPPVSPKPTKTEGSKSFLMRALAPVTNLFRGKQENNSSEGLQRTSSTQSLNASDKEDVDVKKQGAADKGCLENSDEKENNKSSLKYKIRKQESGERAWWLDSNPNIPEGIERIESNSSIDKLKDIEIDGNKTNEAHRPQEHSANCGDNEVQMKRKMYKISHQQSGELPWWQDDSGEVPEGVMRVQSNASLNKLQGDEEAAVNTGRSEGVQKTSSAMSLNKSKDSEPDAAKPPAGKIHRIRHQRSGEMPWWLDSGAPVPEGVMRIQSNTSINKLHDSDTEASNAEKSGGALKNPSNVSLNKDSNSDYDSGKPPVGDEKVKTKLYRLRHQQSGELPWWLDSSAPIPEGVQRIHSNSSINKIQDSDGERNSEEVQRIKSNASINKLQDSDGDSKTSHGVQRVQSSTSVNKLQSSDSESKKSGEGDGVKKKVYRIRRQESGELPWWLDNNASLPEGVQRVQSSHSVSRMQDPEQKEEESNTRTLPYKLRHHESGQKARWLSGGGNVPEGSENLNLGEAKEERAESSSSDSTEDDFREDRKKASGNSVPKFPLELPATTLQSCVSQCDGETGRRSPYDNLQQTEMKVAKCHITKPRPKNLPLFIGSHTNIDDILGTAATLVNPVMGLSRLRKKHEGQGEGSSNEEGKVNLKLQL
jgi:hypothetical protein